MTKHFRDDADYEYPTEPKLDTVLRNAIIRSGKVIEPEWKTVSKAIVKEHIEYYNEMMKEEPKSKCAQCQKEFKYGKSTVGCPKCAPNVKIPESEFQMPIIEDGVWVWEQFGEAFKGSGYCWHERVGYGKPRTDNIQIRNLRKVPYV